MGCQPALGGIALAILLGGPIQLGDELRHQRDDHRMAGCDDGSRQHGMVALRLAVVALTCLAMRTAQFLRTEVFRSIESNQGAVIETLELSDAAVLTQDRDNLIEYGLQQ